MFDDETRHYLHLESTETKEIGLIFSLLDIPFTWTELEGLTINRLVMRSFVYPRKRNSGGPYGFRTNFDAGASGVQKVLSQMAIEAAFVCLSKIYEASDRKIESSALDFFKELFEARGEIGTAFSLLKRRCNDFLREEFQVQFKNFIPGELHLTQDLEGPETAEGTSPLKSLSEGHEIPFKSQQISVKSLGENEEVEHLIQLFKPPGRLKDNENNETNSSDKNKNKKTNFTDKSSIYRPIIRFTQMEHEFRSILIPFVRFDNRDEKFLAFAENGQFFLPTQAQLPKLIEMFESVVNDQVLKKKSKDRLAKCVRRGDTLKTQLAKLPNLTFCDDGEHQSLSEVYKEMALHFYFGSKEIAISNFSKDGFFDRTGSFLAYRKDILRAIETGSKRTENFSYLSCISNLKKLISTITDWLVFSRLFERMDGKINNEARLMDGTFVQRYESVTYGDTFAATFSTRDASQQRYANFVVGSELAREKKGFTEPFDDAQVSFVFEVSKKNEFVNALCEVLLPETKKAIWVELLEGGLVSAESLASDCVVSKFDEWLEECIGDSSLFEKVAEFTCEDDGQWDEFKKMLQSD